MYRFSLLEISMRRTLYPVAFFQTSCYPKSPNQLRSVLLKPFKLEALQHEGRAPRRDKNPPALGDANHMFALECKALSSAPD